MQLSGSQVEGTYFLMHIRKSFVTLLQRVDPIPALSLLQAFLMGIHKKHTRNLVSALAIAEAKTTLP